MLADARGAFAPRRRGVAEARAGLRLLDEAPLRRMQLELRRHLGRQVERVHHHVGRRVDREVERGAPVERADLDHVAPGRDEGRGGREQRELALGDVAELLARLDQIDRVGRQQRRPVHRGQPRDRLGILAAAQLARHAAQPLAERGEGRIERAPAHAIQARAKSREAVGKRGHDPRVKASRPARIRARPAWRGRRSTPRP